MSALHFDRLVGLLYGDTHHGQRNGGIRPGTELIYPGEEKETIYDDKNISDWSKFIWYDVWLPGIEMLKAFAGSDPVISSTRRSRSSVE